MSADSDDPGDEEVTSPVNISLSLGESGDVWVARDTDTGVTTQGQTREAALENLDEAGAGYHGAGESPSDEVLSGMGIDPERLTLIRISHWMSLTCSSDGMPRGPFSGRDIVKVMVNSGIYEWDRTNGDHAILRWEPPAGHDLAARTVPVPLHDEVDMGTL
jgi:predicted RNase H-like HicB family nuclease